MNSINLIKIINSQETEKDRNGNLSNHESLFSLFPLSVKNKIPLLYLESIKKQFENSDQFQKSYTILKERHQAILFLLKQIGKILLKNHIKYAVFKTLKPFPFVASDVDLLFFTRDDFKKALKVFEESKYTIIGPKSSNLTMLDLESSIKIDLYIEVTVSGIVYINKKGLQEYVTETSIDDTKLLVPTEEAELLLVIGHSFYKEQLYTLADFYVITRFITQFTPNQRNLFIKLARMQHIEYACIILLELTQIIHSNVFGTQIVEIAEILERLNLNPFLNATKNKTLKCFRKKMRLPYKYDYRTMVAGFVDKIFEDKKTRVSVLYEIKDLLSKPQFLKEFVANLVIHMTRETY